LNGETYVVSINEFSATCNWQVVGVQVEQNRCKDLNTDSVILYYMDDTGVYQRIHTIERSELYVYLIV